MDIGNDPLRDIDHIDRVIHEPARLALMAYLSVVEEADFVFLVQQIGLSPGNAGSHLKKLCDAGYLSMAKTFAGNRPQTVFSATERGRGALASYCRTMAAILHSVECVPAG
jgi:predicted ArsR family transcriptional regulator